MVLLYSCTYLYNSTKIALYSKMNGKPKAESIEIHVTELFGVQVLRKYVDRAGKIDKEANCGMRILLQSLSVAMLLPTIICAGVILGVLYYPPPLLKDISETVFLNFGKGETIALREQLLNANDRIRVLAEENEKLKRQGRANFTREEGLRHNLSTIEKDSTNLLQKLSEANKSIMLLKEVDSEKGKKIQELEEDFDTCIKEKTNIQKLLSDAEKQASDGKRYLNECKQDTEKINSEIEQLQNNISSLQKELLKADNISLGLENSLNKRLSSLALVEKQKESIHKNLLNTKSSLGGCKTENENYLKTNVELHANLTASQENVSKTNEKFQNSQFMLGKCRNKNMDHETLVVELLTELESCEKELKIFQTD